jgi:hypothetical protein
MARPDGGVKMASEPSGGDLGARLFKFCAKIINVVVC